MQKDADGGGNQFGNDVANLYTSLAELHAIDAILAEVDKQHLRDLNYTGSPSTGGGPKNTYLNLGTTYPFKIMVRSVNTERSGGGYPFSDPGTTSETPVDFSFVDSAYTAASTWATNSQTSFFNEIEPLFKVDPSAFSDISYAICDTYATLQSKIPKESWSGLGGEASEWEGEGADAFFKNFERPFVDILASHLWAMDYLNSLVCGLKACNDAGQVSVKNLVASAAKLVDQQLQKRANDERGNAAQGLNILAMLLGIGSVLLFPVPGAAAVLGSASYMLNYAATTIPADSQDTDALEATGATDLHGTLITKADTIKTRVKSAFGQVESKVGDFDKHLGEVQAPIATGSKVDKWIPIEAEVDPGPNWYHESRN